MASVTVAANRRAREAYFSASQGELIWARFRRNRAAMAAAGVLVVLMLAGFFAPFLSPYDPTINGRDAEYMNGAPQIPRFCDHNGCSARPFLYTLERTRSIETNFRWVTTVMTEAGALLSINDSAKAIKAASFFLSRMLRALMPRPSLALKSAPFSLK